MSYTNSARGMSAFQQGSTKGRLGNANLSFESGPTQPVQLQWATYYDAADQAGLSRIWGGIHPPVDDFAGRRVGSQCGQAVWALAQKYFDGSVVNTPITIDIRVLGPGQVELRFNTLRGMYYQLQTTWDLTQTFTNDFGPLVQAFDSSLARSDSLTGAQKFYRALSSIGP